MSAGEGLSRDRPYPGLRPFGDHDRAFFFGREEQNYALYNLLDLSQFVAVVGSSGSGKSSLVRAGLLPLLERESEEVLAREDSVGRVWRWIELRPGDEPLSRLAGQLAVVAAGKGADPLAQAAQRERINAALRRASFGMTEALAGMEALADRSLLIVVDQFEELFRYGGATHARSQQEREQFVQLLLEATSNHQVDVHVLITMRSDFIGDCAQFYGLPEAVSACQFLVPSLTREQREEVIRRPLDPGLADAAIEPALVERLLNDAGDELDQLPVLQHCLSRLWEVAGPSAASSPHRELRIEHYAEVGGISHALSQHADLILAGLADQEVAVEQVFRALSEVDGEGRATRRALSYADLLAETGVEDSELRRVVDRFRADDCSFLIPSVSAVPKLADHDTVDIGHEALLRRWRRIGAEADESLDGEPGWLEAEASDARFYRAMLALGTARTLPLEIVDEKWAWWRERPRTAAWAERYGGRIGRIEELFANSLRAAHRRHWIRVGAATVGAVVLIGVVCGIAAFFYLDNRHRAEIAEIQSRDAKIEAELAQRQTDIAREERTVLLNELTDITQKISTQLRFAPGTSTTIAQMLAQVQDFSNRFHVLLKAHSAGELSDQDQRVAARLDFTAKILQADFDINFGKVGEAITILKSAEADLAKIPTINGQPSRSVQLLLADLRKHRADGETLYAATDDARRDYAAAAEGYVALSNSPPPSAGEESQSGADYPQTAKQRLAELYQGRLFLELQFINDGNAAAEDFARYKELVAEQSAAHPPSAHDQLGDYWAQQQSRLDRLQADVWVAQGRLDAAVQTYNRLIQKGSSVTTVLAEVSDAFLKYKAALALTKRARGSDLADAIGLLKHADDVFSRLAANDPKNSWWPLVCSWIERTLGDAYMQQHDAGNAATAYQIAINRDLTLRKFDEQNPRVEKDLRQDTAALAAAKSG